MLKQQLNNITNSQNSTSSNDYHKLCYTGFFIFNNISEI